MARSRRSPLRHSADAVLDRPVRRGARNAGVLRAKNGALSRAMIAAGTLLAR